MNQPDELSQQVRRGARAVIGLQLAGQVVSIIVLAALYRLVDPSQFGLLGMILPVTLLLRSVGTLGLNVAAVQQRDLSQSQASALFWIQIFAGLALTIVAAAIAPALAYFYAAPDVLIPALAMSGTALAANLYTQHQAMAEKRLRLGELAVARFVSQLLAGVVSIAIAFGGGGIWALIAQQYVELLLLTAGVWWIEPWRPDAPRKDPTLSPLLHFGGYYTLSGLLFAAAQNLDKVLLALLIGHTEAGQRLIGFYSQAYNQMMKPVYLTTVPLASAMLPALAATRDDQNHFRDTAAEFYRFAAIVLAPCSAGLAVVGQTAMVVLGGPEWQTAGLILSIMALAALAQGLINICGSLLAAVGQAKRLALGAAAISVVLAIGYAVAVAIARQADGDMAETIGLAIAYAAGTLLVAPFYLAYCFLVSDADGKRMAWTMSPAILAAIGMGLLTFGLQWLLLRYATLPPIVTLALTILFGVVVYIGLAFGEVRWLLRRMRND
ncbi:oligosaccharide flippase family protein [Blastopirellula sp. JC732]|uniref:Oligosaccharide flippase family protein n=1 Tax=Blastopirellula sediminis TaxID=2894196 RepID=A0A9X1SFJ0_9BACT|nr:oligosaccharide flippase family protein [Blastopirellula sediminis]MCC9607447.1 oligosaccharide flippase family protein [Blastopirellula sediminis]MCC9629260.1 oligosaccharide flippase family protein [Blastopirellula sediminis]